MDKQEAAKTIPTSDNLCSICGHEVEGAEGVDVEKEIMYFCNDCQRYVCPDCFWPISRRCDKCIEEYILSIEEE